MFIAQWASGIAVAIVPLAASADPLAVLVNYGALGVFLLCILTGLVRTRSEVERLEKQLAEKQAQIDNGQRQIDALIMNITGQTLPALAKSTQVLEHLPRGEAAIISELQNVAALLQEMKSDGDSNSGQRKG